MCDSFFLKDKNNIILFLLLPVFLSPLWYLAVFQVTRTRIVDYSSWNHVSWNFSSFGNLANVDAGIFFCFQDSSQGLWRNVWGTLRSSERWGNSKWEQNVKQSWRTDHQGLYVISQRRWLDLKEVWKVLYGREPDRSSQVSSKIVTGSPLYTSLQAGNLQRCEHVFHQHQAWVKLFSVFYCWRSFSSTISHHHSLLQSVALLACSLTASSCMPTAILYYCTFQAVILLD